VPAEEKSKVMRALVMKRWQKARAKQQGGKPRG
jgi:hypothetical protein